MYGYGYGYGLDPTYILVLIGLAICLWASANVRSTYTKYAKIRSRSGLTGAQVAQEILRRNGVQGITIRHVSGDLTDHYNPANGTVNLSDAVYNSTSVAALGVAAHECGHVMQHEQGYVPLTVRTALVPIANIGSQAGWLIFVLGLVLSMNSFLLQLGIILFSAAVLFQLVTLPVEFNASRRALQMLQDYGMLGEDEVGMSRKVLRAAALTYVASAASAILQLLRMRLLAGNRRD